MNAPLVAETVIIHYGPVWYKRGMEHFSFAACEALPPNAMSTHKPWINCEACKQTREFKGEV